VLESVHEGAEDFAELLTAATVAVLVVTIDPQAPNGWRTDAKVMEWLTPATLAAVLRQAADRYDPPRIVDFAAEHHPDCTCDQCATVRGSGVSPDSGIRNPESGISEAGS
jgi:hypothetical protein